MWDILIRDIWFYLINLGALVVVGLAIWLWTRQNWLWRLAQVKTELASLRLGQTDFLAKLEDEYKAKEEHVRLVLQDLLKHWESGDLDMLRARRNELSNIWILDYRKALSSYVRSATDIYEDNRHKQYLLIENHLLPFLQLSGDLLDTLNQADLLDKLQAQPMVLQYQDFDFIFDFTRLYLSWKDWNLRRALKKHRRRLGL